ncbi:MAG: ATP-binding protein [Firmicutes bacterium]|nr:ATP-binding protein [Bacillota bacterium]
MTHDRRLLWLAGGSLLPLGLLALIFALWPHLVRPWKVVLGVAAVAASVAMLRLLRRGIQRPLQTLSNVLAALRQGDYAFRARTKAGVDPLATVFHELNSLSELLAQQRMKAMEATALLRTVMSEIDVAVFAFDEHAHLRLVNRAGELLLARSHDGLLGAEARELNLHEALAGEGPRLVDLDLPGRAGRFEVRRGAFRQGGRPHQPLVLSDLTRPLREEERQAWQRLIRVLGHEINNSLAPIQSLSGSIGTMIQRQGEDWQADAHQGLSIIASRAQALGRFMEAYTRLARLPEPRMGEVEARALAHKVAALESRLPVQVAEGPSVRVQADGDQLEQALINLVRNAVEATLGAGQRVVLTWTATAESLTFIVEDEGPGLPVGGNLFVPFFTTKPGGSGIGLLLARQIAEGHGGTLRLVNREPVGARALLRLPLYRS